MNERIRELAEQAGMRHPVMGEVSYASFDYVKFAELIVRECADVAADHDALDIYEEIREHFGVER
jgi:hypothetical protein